MQHVPRHIQTCIDRCEVSDGVDDFWDEVAEDGRWGVPDHWQDCPRCGDYMCTHSAGEGESRFVVHCCLCGYHHYPTWEFLSALTVETLRWYLREWNLWLERPYPAPLPA